MCLVTVDEKPNRSYGTGYKVFEFREGKIRGWIAWRMSDFIGRQPIYEMNKWYKDTNEHTIQDFGHRNIAYPTGYHIMLSQEDALEYDFGHEYHSVFKVRFRKVVATGLDGMEDRTPTVVAKEMMILERIK